MDGVSKNLLNTEKLLDELKLEESKEPKINAQENNFDHFNFNANVHEEGYQKKEGSNNRKGLVTQDKVIIDENLDYFKVNLCDDYNNVTDHVDLKINYGIEKLLKNDDEKVTTNGENAKIIVNKKKGESKSVKSSEQKGLNTSKNDNTPFFYDKVNEKDARLYGDNNEQLDSHFIKKFEEKTKLKSETPCDDINSMTINLKSDEEGANEEIKHKNNNLFKNIVNSNHNELHNVDVTNDRNKAFEKKEIYRKNSLVEYSSSGIEIHKIKNKELSKDKKNNNKSRSKNLLKYKKNNKKKKIFFFSLFKKIDSSNSNAKEKDICIEINNNLENVKNNTYDSNTAYTNFLEEKIELETNCKDKNKDKGENGDCNISSDINVKNNFNSDLNNLHYENNVYINNSHLGCIKTNDDEDDLLCENKDDNHIVLDINQCNKEINQNFSKHKVKLYDRDVDQNTDRSNDRKNDNITKDYEEFNKNKEKKVCGLEKIKSYMSNNIHFQDKKSILIEKKSSISKNISFFCNNYNTLLCILLYLICFVLIIIVIFSDSWKIHETALKSINNKKSIIVHIGINNIRRIQKITEKNGDIYLSIEKEQSMKSLLESEYCKPIEKEFMESEFTKFASNKEFKINDRIDDISIKLSDEHLVSALKNPGNVGMLDDKKLILARKYIIGSTIYNLECKFLKKLIKIGYYHKIFLCVILIFLFISISLLSYIIIRYKSIHKTQKIKYISFFFVNLALALLISFIFSISREYNIPLCVQNDGSSDICTDGLSIQLVRITIILIIFSNIFFSKFLKEIYTKNTKENSITE